MKKYNLRKASKYRDIRKLINKIFIKTLIVLVFQELINLVDCRANI